MGARRPFYRYATAASTSDTVARASTVDSPTLALTAMVLAAALPMGANVFLFSQRYKVAEELITAGIAVSTGLGLVTLSLVMWMLLLSSPA